MSLTPSAAADGVIIFSPLRGFLWSLVKFSLKKSLVLPILYRRTLDFTRSKGTCPAVLRDLYMYDPRCNRGAVRKFWCPEPRRWRYYIFCFAAYGALQFIRPCKPRVLPGVIIVSLLRSYCSPKKKSARLISLTLILAEKRR